MEESVVDDWVIDFKWTDVDLEAKTVNVNKTMDYHNRDWFETLALKTAASRRTVACLGVW